MRDFGSWVALLVLALGLLIIGLSGNTGRALAVIFTPRIVVVSE